MSNYNNTLNFRQICDNEFKNIHIPKKKKSNTSLLKTLSKITPEECKLLLSTYPEICSKNYLHKSALHWACDNKNVDVLKETLNFYKSNDLNIFIESKIDKKTEEKYNIAYYSLMKGKVAHFLLAFSHGLKIFNEQTYINNSLFYKNNSFSLYQIFSSYEYYNVDSYVQFLKNIPEHWFINPLNFSFWHQNKTLLNIILKNNFLEKDLWMTQLKEEIYHMLSVPGSTETIFDSVIFYLLDYVNLDEVLEIINNQLDKNKNFIKDEYIFVANSLELFFSSRYNNSSNFNEYIMKCFNSNKMKQWKKFELVLKQCGHLDSNSLPYLNSISKIELSYMLQSNLSNKNSKTHNSGKI